MPTPRNQPSIEREIISQFPILTQPYWSSKVQSQVLFENFIKSSEATNRPYLSSDTVRHQNIIFSISTILIAISLLKIDSITIGGASIKIDANSVLLLCLATISILALFLGKCAIDFKHSRHSYHEMMRSANSLADHVRSEHKYAADQLALFRSLSDHILSTPSHDEISLGALADQLQSLKSDIRKYSPELRLNAEDIYSNFAFDLESFVTERKLILSGEHPIQYSFSGRNTQLADDIRDMVVEHETAEAIRALFNSYYTPWREALVTLALDGLLSGIIASTKDDDTKQIEYFFATLREAKTISKNYARLEIAIPTLYCLCSIAFSLMSLSVGTPSA